MIKKYTPILFVCICLFPVVASSQGLDIYQHNQLQGEINLPLLHSEFDVNENLKKRGVVPDYSNSNSFHDIISEKDGVLEFVLYEINR